MQPHDPPASASRTRVALLLGALLAAPGAMSAAVDPAPAPPLEGVVRDLSGDPIAGAVVSFDGVAAVTTDDEGRFRLAAGDGGEIRVTCPGFEPLVLELAVDAPRSGLVLVLSPELAVSDAITITALRAGDDSPVTKRNLDAAELDHLSHGQDVPSLLQSTPSITWYSDSGTGSNYSYFSLRGIQQTRINITFDGAPLNDPAEHALYFNNFHDFISAVDSVQIQRGVGTSTVGAPSFGGSVNFASPPLAEESGLEARLTLGSFATQRGSVAWESGRLARGVAVATRFSFNDTDGYRDNSGSEHRTGFLNAEWRGTRSRLKFVSFAGVEESQLAFLAVDPQTLAENPRSNPLSPEEHDRFQQRFAQLKYTVELGGDSLLEASLYYNGADGWFRLWDDPVARGSLLEFGIDQYFVGSLVTLSRTVGRLSTTAGVHYNDFRGDHTLDLEGLPIYRNTGFKREANAFVKGEYLLDRWVLFGDLHLRWSEFRYAGDLDLGAIDWLFADPKIGFRYRLTPDLSVYASLGKAEREPTRMDLLAGEDNATVAHDLAAVEPERVIDLETGLDYERSGRVVRATLYSMEFRDEIALTGELSEIGLPLRRNIDRSYRRGLELDLRWPLGEGWTVTHASNLSRNRIRRWTQFYDRFDAAGRFLGSEARTYDDVEPLLTPEVVVNQGIAWSRGGARLSVDGRYVGASHLDNTADERFRAPSYVNVDLRASLELGRWPSAGVARVRLFVANLLDDGEQYAGGYSYLFLQEDAGGGATIDGIPFYYPLAGRSFMVTLDWAR